MSLFPGCADTIQICLTEPTTRHARLPGMDLSKMTRQEIEALLKMLAEMKRQQIALLMWERRYTERQGRLHYPT
jgi:hypothetical protein